MLRVTNSIDISVQIFSLHDSFIFRVLHGRNITYVSLRFMFTRNIKLCVSENKEFIEASIERKREEERKWNNVNRYCERCKPSVCIYGATVELEVFEFELEPR